MRSRRTVCLPELEGHKPSYCIDSWLPKYIAQKTDLDWKYKFVIH